MSLCQTNVIEIHQNELKMILKYCFVKGYWLPSLVSYVILYYLYKEKYILMQYSTNFYM